MDFVNSLCSILDEQKLSKAELSRRSNLSKSTITEYTTGVREPSLRNAVILAQTLNVSLDTLAGISTVSAKDSGTLALFNQLNECNRATIVSNIHFLLSQQRMREVE